MAKGQVNWDSPETWHRVVASIIATGVKLDLRQMATYFGCTYDTLENRFRKIKKEAKVLEQEVESGERGEVTPSRTKSTPKATPKKTPKKDPLSSVANGRISKTTPKSKKDSIKQEMQAEEDAHSIMGDFADGDTLGSDYNFNFGDMV